MREAPKQKHVGRAHEPMSRGFDLRSTIFVFRAILPHSAFPSAMFCTCTFEPFVLACARSSRANRGPARRAWVRFPSLRHSIRMALPIRRPRRMDVQRRAHQNRLRRRRTNAPRRYVCASGRAAWMVERASTVYELATMDWALSAACRASDARSPRRQLQRTRSQRR